MYSCSSLKSWAKSEGCCEHGMGCGAGELVPCSPLGLPLILLPLWGSAQQTSLLSCEHVPCFSPSTALLFIQLSLLHPVSLHIFVELSGLLLAPCLSLLAAEGREACYGSWAQWVGKNPVYQGQDFWLGQIIKLLYFSFLICRWGYNVHISNGITYKLSCVKFQSQHQCRAMTTNTSHSYQ